MIRLNDRLLMAWLAFRCKPFSLLLEPYHVYEGLKPGVLCDNSFAVYPRVGCKNDSVVCMTRTEAEFRISQGDHEHLCPECADKIKGQY